MREVSKSELKAKMLEYFREVERTGEELIVLDHRVPVLKVVPIPKRRTVAAVFGPFQGGMKAKGDLNQPTVDEWSET